MTDLTAKEKIVYNWVKRYIEKHGTSPTLQEIAGRKGSTSPSRQLALVYLKNLEMKGYIERVKEIKLLK